jgi:signal transduction histidine kinase/DNA-binding response OmpR family regulator
MTTAEGPTPSSFYDFVAPDERRRLLTAAALAAVFVPGFGVVDRLMYPEQFKLLLAIRGVLCLASIGAFALTATARTYRQLATISFSLFIVLCGGLSSMMPFIGGHRSEYFLGIVQVFLGAALLFTWPRWVSAAGFGIALAFYFVPILFEPAIDVRLFASHGGFMVIIAAIAMICMQMRMSLSEKAFLASQALAKSNADLKELNREKDQMFQNISHEFRTPLTLILAPAERLMETSPPEQRAAFEIIRDNTLRLLNLINDLLDLAKLSAVGVTVFKRPVSVGHVLNRLARDAGELATRQKLRLDLELDSGLPNYALDARYFEKAVLNLLSNAFKFTPPGGTVVLAARDGPKGLVVEVRDSGPGIPEELRGKLFHRFQQLDEGSTRRYGGTGIGLALVQELVTLMGGQVLVASDVGRGSTFSLHFPATMRTQEVPTDGLDSMTSAIAAMSRQAALSALATERRTDGIQEGGDRGPKILVAEDDVGLSRQLMTLLVPSYRVTCVSNGKEALARAIQDPPHVVISDVMMPEMDGLQLAAALRDLPALRDTAIALLSARADLDDRVAGRKIGVDTYLTKPFHPAELLATLEGLLRSRLRLVGPYLLHRPIASGGQGEIFLAERVETGELAAVKLLGRTATDTTSRERLKREAQVLQKLRHPNVVRFLDHGFAQDRAYLAVEFLVGSTLRGLLDAHQPIDPGSIAAIGRALADGLAAVHAAGVLHRDIKCENVMILSDGKTIADRVRLIDFGIVQDHDAASLTREGQVVGTITYLAPELMAGSLASPQSDIYAAGVVLYALATGGVPFKDRNPSSLLQSLAKEGVPRADRARPNLPPGLAEIIAKATALAPVNRYASSAELRDALDGLGLPPGELSVRSAFDPGLNIAATSARTLAVPKVSA